MKPKTTPACIILFVKAPIPGKVKTRLASGIGPDNAANLYACFTKDIIRTASIPCCDLKIFYHPARSKQLIRQLLGEDLQYLAQSGKDLGDKMTNAFNKMFAQQYSRAVLIGSDIPDLPENILNEAFSKLEIHDAVIGPSRDGGYYLIGFRKATFNAGIFKNIAWSTGSVFFKTCLRIASLGLDVHFLPKWRDIDTYQDLADLAASLANSKTTAEETKKFLGQMKLKNL